MARGVAFWDAPAGCYSFYTRFTAGETAPDPKTGKPRFVGDKFFRQAPALFAPAKEKYLEVVPLGAVAQNSALGLQDSAEGSVVQPRHEPSLGEPEHRDEGGCTGQRDSQLLGGASRRAR